MNKAQQQLWHAVQRLGLAADLYQDAGDRTASELCARMQREAEGLMLTEEKDEKRCS